MSTLSNGKTREKITFYWENFDWELKEKFVETYEKDGNNCWYDYVKIVMENYLKIKWKKEVGFSARND